MTNAKYSAFAQHYKDGHIVTLLDTGLGLDTPLSKEEIYLKEEKKTYN